MTTFKANRKFPNPITVTDDPKSHTLALQQIIEALSIGQRRTKEINSSYVRVHELVDVGLVEIVGNQLKLTNLGSGVASGAGGGGGGSAPTTPDTHPSSPNAMDDEFDGSSLDTGLWTWFNQGSATATFDIPGALVLYTPAAGSDTLRGIVQAVSGSSWKFRAKIATQSSGANGGTNYHGGGITVRNSSGSKNHFFGVMYAGGWLLYVDQRTDSAYVGAGTSSTLSNWQGHWADFCYLEVELAAGVLYFRHSLNGYLYRDLYSVAVSSYLGSITDIGLAVFVNNGSYPSYTICDWFRKVA